MGKRTFFDDDEGPAERFDLQLLRRLARYIAPHKGLIALAVSCTLLSMGARLGWTYLFAPAIDRVADKGGVSALKPLLLGFLLLPLVWFVLQFIQIYTVNYVGQHGMHRLRRELFGKLQRLSPSYYDKNPLGRIMTRVTNDAEVLNELFSSGVVAAIADVVMLVGILAMLFYLNASLTLRVICLVPFVALASILFRKFAHAAFRKVRRRLAALNAFLQENISGIRIVQAFNREERSQQRFEELNGRLRNANLEAVLCFSLFFPAIEFLAICGSVIVIWYGGNIVLGQPLSELTDPSFTIGELFGYMLFVGHFFEPLRDLSEKFNILQSAMAAAERIAGVLDTPEEITSPAKPVKLGPFQQSIVFENVWFAYDARKAANDTNASSDAEQATSGKPAVSDKPAAGGDKPAARDWALRDVSFEVKRGERVAIVGPTGAGKTSLISLLARFYDLQQGSIMIDGVDLRLAQLSAVRQKLALVLQDVFLFSGNVTENIRLANDEIGEERVKQAARAVNAEPFIERLPDGYQSLVREGGATLSMGQRQLLAFARALAHDPEILVLDEATSNIDTETELLIQDALEKLFKGRTSIVIAHRLSTIRNADKIVVLHHGRVREVGSHAELLRLNGLYRRLCEMQYGFATT
jgi:ATP-binding cassette subfamily B multidrug efflux pump